MYLVLSNIKTDKKLIISCKYKQLLLDMNHSWFDNVNYLNHHLYQVASFIKSLKKEFSQILLIKNIYENTISETNVFFSFDISHKDIRLIQNLSKRKNIKLILSISEHPFYQIKDFDNYLEYFDYVYSTYKVNSKYHKTINSYVFKEIPIYKASSSISNFKDASIICSNLHTFKKSNYRFRRHLINTLSSIDQINFEWYGKGWDICSPQYNFKNKIKYLKSSFFSYPKLNNNAISKYKGKLESKTILTSFKFNLSVENFSWPKGFFSEKFFEPLIYGCIPIYLGPDIPPEFEVIKSLFNDFIINKNDSHKVVNLIFKYKDYDITQTKNLALKLRNEFNMVIKKSNYNTNFYRSLRKILENY